MVVTRSINEPIRKNISFDERLNDYDKGLILAWEVGRRVSMDRPDIVERVNNGELPQLNHKGGHAKMLTSTDFKYGTFQYLAEIQGIKGEDLYIDTDLHNGTIMVCSKTMMKTIFTSDISKFREV